MQCLTMGNVEEKAKTLSDTKTSYGEQQYSTLREVNIFDSNSIREALVTILDRFNSYVQCGSSHKEKLQMY